LDLCFYTLSLQAFFVVLSFLSPGIRDFFSGIVVNRGNIDIDHLFRFRGLHDSGGFTLSAFLGMGAVYGVFSFMRRKKQLGWVHIFLSFILFFSVSLVGRTGFLVVGLGIFLLAIRWPAKMLWAMLLAYFFVLLFLLFAPILFAEQYNFFNSNVFDYAFEFVVNFQNGQGFRTDSSDDLKTMLFIPDIWNILFGNGSFDKGYAGVPQTDSGYMKTLMASGLLGFLMVYGAFSFIAKNIFTSLTPYKDLRYFILIVFALMFFIEIKGPVFYQNDISRFFWLLYGTLLAYSQPYKKNHANIARLR
jgi:hypothetical protein